MTGVSLTGEHESTMRTMKIAAIVCVLLAVALADNQPLVISTVSGAGSGGHPSPPTVLSHAYETLPLTFEINRGQTASDVRFLARGRDYTLFLRADSAALALAARAGTAQEGFVRLRYLRANPHPAIVGLHKLPGKVNYFIGNNPRRWQTNIPTFAAVEYRGIYHGVNLVFFGRQGHMEYDWLLQPRADPRNIRLDVTGSAGLHLDHHGNLALWSEGSVLLQQKPVAFQQVGSTRREVVARYVLRRPHQVSFQLGRYEGSRPLVIDPTLIYSTYLGGQDADGAFGIAVDSKGEAYVTGDTFSHNFPTAHPVQADLRSDPACADIQGRGGAVCTDAFVSKLNASGSGLVYSTYLGGSRDDSGHAIAVDHAGNAYVTGNTLSSDFPTLKAAQPRFGGGSVLGDAFVTELSSTGNRLVFSTYLGGSGDDDGNGIAVSGGSVYVTGRTNSSNFPTMKALQRSRGGGRCRYDFDPHASAPCYDAFVTRLNQGGAILSYSTYLGGGASDFGWGIAVHKGHAIVVGQTNSTNFPTMHALQRSLQGGSCSGCSGNPPVVASCSPAPCSDAFIAELNTAGSALTFSTYLGGTGEDIANGVAVDGAGNAYVVGKTESSDFPTTRAFQSHFVGGPDMAFVSKIDTTRHAWVYSTFLGGNDSDEAYGVALNNAGDAFVTGRTSSANFPIVRAFQSRIAGKESPQNAFVTELNAAGSALVYSTYLGGNDHDLGGGIAIDTTGDAYITGDASSLNFPTVRPLQAKLAGGTFDAFVAKIGNLPVKLPQRTCRAGYKLTNGKCQRKHP